MKNVEMEVNEDQVLIIKVDLKKQFGESASGKSITIGTTQGNVKPDQKYQDIRVGVNVYQKI